MIVNSTRDLMNEFKKFTSLNDLPKKFQVSHKGELITMYKVGAGMSGGEPQVAYLGDGPQSFRLTYSIAGNKINIQDVKFSDENPSMANVVPSATAMPE